MSSPGRTRKLKVADKIAGISDEAVIRRTGRSWSEWIAELDRAGARDMDHKAIACHLWETHPEIGGWWCQMVTVGYEQARGKRAKNETPEGFQVSASKTVSVPLEALYEAWANERSRRKWLPGAPITVRKATPGKSLRMGWEDGESRLAIHFYAKGPGKSQVAVYHGRLPDEKTAERSKAYWKSALARFAKFLEDGS